MLTRLRYFLSRPQPCLIGPGEAKIAESDLATGSIDLLSAGNVSVWDVSGKFFCASNPLSECNYVDA